MIGREVELRRVLDSLEGDAPAVVSIAGVAGSGKSTVAAATATALAEDQGWTVAWVDVAAELAAMPSSVMVQRCLAVDNLDLSTLRLAAYGRRILIVLDGADGRLRDIAEAVAPLERCPSVRVVLTSIRGIKGRNIVSVPLGGLEVPPTEADGPELTKYSSVELFVSVATQVHAGFVADEATLTDVARVCRSLNGLPLAVKLAAGRLSGPLSTPARMSNHVQGDPAFGLMLADGGPDAGSIVHQRSVRAALDWTYSFLDPTQRHVLRRTCVFRGPFGLEAAEQVCETSKYKVLEALEDLAGLGLLEASDQAAAIRFEIHPLIRGFGTEALAETGETARSSDLHASFISSLARRASRLSEQCLNEAAVELRSMASDLYAALDYLIDAGRKMEALRLAVDLGHVAAAAGNDEELLARLVGLLADLPPEGDQGVVADGWLWAAGTRDPRKDGARHDRMLARQVA